MNVTCFKQTLKLKRISGRYFHNMYLTVKTVFPASIRVAWTNATEQHTAACYNYWRLH